MDHHCAELAVPDCPLAALDDEIEDEQGGDGEGASSVGRTPMRRAKKSLSPRGAADNGGEGSGGSNSSSTTTSITANLSRSLEDLVTTFDQKITKVLKNMGDDAENLAPVQVRTQEEVMNESEVWWTLTGNYGQMPPLDFNNSQIRKNQLKALGVGAAVGAASKSTSASTDDGLCDEEGEDEEELRERLDLHQLVNQHSAATTLNGEHPPLTAEQVIEEIDEIYQNHDLIRSMTANNGGSDGAMLGSGGCDELRLPSYSSHHHATSGDDSLYSSMRSPPYTASSSAADSTNQQQAALSVSGEELQSLSQSKLVALQAEMEQLILMLNTDLVQELAHRDELDYEKEVKNRFITLLVQLQERRRKLLSGDSSSVKKTRSGGKSLLSSASSAATSSISSIISPSTSTSDHQLLTTSIPYDASTAKRTLQLGTLESLIKILQAIAENDPSVPTLLTEYILTIVCPPAPASTAQNASVHHTSTSSSRLA